MTYNRHTTIPTDGLVASYDLDGSADDSSGNGNNGTATNITWLGADRGYVEEVASFNGTSSRITVPMVALGTNDFSWAVWFKTTSTTARVMASTTQTTGYPTFINNADGTLAFRITSGGSIDTTSNSLLNDGEYHLAVGVRSGTDMKLYIDGVLEDTQTKSGAMNGTTLYLGNFSSLVSGTYWLGEVGLFKNYNKALSQDEINNLYEEGLRRLGPTNAALSGNFPKYSLPNLEEGKVLEISRPQSGGSYIDQTGNGNTGTPTNVVDSSNGLYNVMSFNGSNSWIQTPDLISGTTSFSISSMVKFNSVSGIEPITANWASGTNQHLLRNNGGVLQFFLETNIASYQPSGGTLVAGKTYNIIATYDGGVIKAYIDGEEVISLAASGVVKNGTALDGFGRYNTTYLDGQIISPTIYNRALSEREVKEDYYANKII